MEEYCVASVRKAHMQELHLMGSSVVFVYPVQVWVNM